MWKLVRIWILSSWSFLTIGILLGSWWAYHELGWGGWWFWDPVENASLMPWLLATACIHSITKPKLNYWTLIFAQTTFILSVLGTFFVRSGLLSSVHSFATDSTRGLYLLFFLISITTISVFNWISFCFNTSLYGKLSRLQTSLGMILPSKNLFRSWPGLWPSFKHRRGEAAHSCRRPFGRTFRSLFKMTQFGSLRSSRSRLRIQFCKKSAPLSTDPKPQAFPVGNDLESHGTLSGELSTTNSGWGDGQKKTMKSVRSTRLLRERMKPRGAKRFDRAVDSHEKPKLERYVSVGGIQPPKKESPVALVKPNKTTAPVLLTKEFPLPGGRQLFSEMKRSIEQILLLQNFYLCLICMIVFCGTSAPLFFQWFWDRDVGTGAPFYNAICIPLFTSVFFVLAYVHYIQFTTLNMLVLYCIFFFLVHVGLCVQIIGLNFLESIYAAICFLLISSILLSTCLRAPNSSIHNTIITSFLSLPSRHLILRPNLKTCSQNFNDRTQLFLLKGIANVNCSTSGRPMQALRQCGTGGSSFFKVGPYSHVLESHSEIHFQSDNELPPKSSHYAKLTPMVVKLTPVVVPFSGFLKVVNFGGSSLVKNDSFNGEQFISLQPQVPPSTQSYASHSCRLRRFAPFRFINGKARSLIDNLQINGRTQTLPRLLEESTILGKEKRPQLKAVHCQDARKNSDKRVAIMPTMIETRSGCQLNVLRIKVIQATSPLNASLQMNIAHTGLALFIIGILFSNTFKFEFTEQLHSGPSGIRLGSQICCLRSIDHSFAPTYHSICANLLIYKQINIDSSWFFTGSFSRFVHNTKQALERSHFDHQVAELCMFPEKRFYYLNEAVQGGPSAGNLATKVAIHSNLFTDFYSLIGTGSFETGWFTTIMKLPFIFCIWLGFILGVIGGIFSLKKQLQLPRLYWP